MNKTISECLTKAEVPIMCLKHFNGHIDIEKFAELIVNECIAVIQHIDFHDAHTTYDLGLVKSTIAKCQTRLKDHFGVE